MTWSGTEDEVNCPFLKCQMDVVMGARHILLFGRPQQQVSKQACKGTKQHVHMQMSVFSDSAMHV